MNIRQVKGKLAQTGTKVKGVFAKNNLKKNLIIFASLAVIGGAVYLNWNYFAVGGEAEVISSDDEVSEESSDSYFAMTEVSRKRTRDEAMEVLQAIVDNESAAEADRTEALNSINAIAENIQSEGNIESLVMSKGFEDCVAVVSDGNATVVVKSDGLLENEITQIQEIVYNESGILPENLRIVEKAE